MGPKLCNHSTFINDNSAAFKQTDPKLVLLDTPTMELHIANIMVAAKFIIERDSTKMGVAEGMQQIL